MPRGPAPAQQADGRSPSTAGNRAPPVTAPSNPIPYAAPRISAFYAAYFLVAGGGAAVLAALPEGARALGDGDRADARAHAHAPRCRRPLHRPLRRPPRQHEGAARRLCADSAAGCGCLLLDLGLLADLRGQHYLHPSLRRRAAVGGDHRAPHRIGRVWLRPRAALGLGLVPHCSRRRRRGAGDRRRALRRADPHHDPRDHRG